jgi:tyrosine-protein phosphatase SIW14
MMSDPAVPKPVLIHCFAGIHRTGGHVAAYRIERNGWTPEEALRELQAHGTRRTTYAPNLVEFVRSFQPQPSVGNTP